jgi:outer membrane protein OmpA-like peptidoglycan-associated protein
MKPQFGVCKNKVGCSFAYTGEKIPVPADSMCPECGQPLVVNSSKKGGAKILIVLGVLLFLVLLSGGAVLFAFREQIFHLAFNKPETNKTAEGQGEEVVVNPSPAENPGAPGVPANSPNAASTPDSSSASQEKVLTAPTETPAPEPPASVNEDKRNTLSQPAATPLTVVQPENPPANQAARPDSDNASGGETQPPATLTKSEVDATREDVLKRINAMPRFTGEEKKRLSEKMETARSMERLMVIRFDTGQSALSRNAADNLMKRIRSKEVEDKVSDPTVVFVVAGYADAAGDPKSNLQISQQRADNVTRVLKDKTNLLNVIHSVGMGSTALLDSKRSDQNRAVEVWAVEP